MKPSGASLAMPLPATNYSSSSAADVTSHTGGPRGTTTRPSLSSMRTSRPNSTSAAGASSGRRTAHRRPGASPHRSRRKAASALTYTSRIRCLATPTPPASTAPNSTHPHEHVAIKLVAGLEMAAGAQAALDGELVGDRRFDFAPRGALRFERRDAPLGVGEPLVEDRPIR